MKNKKTVFLIIVLLMVCFIGSAHSAGFKMFDLKTKSEITLGELSSTLDGNENIVLGEYHYTLPIQDGEGIIIRSIVKNLGLQGAFTVGWEFLNYVEQSHISLAFDQFARGDILGDDLMIAFFGKGSDVEMNRPYLKVMEAIRDLDGELIGTNALRSVKKQIIDDGLDSIAPELVPPQIEIGGANYRERFLATMHGHVPPEKVEPYFIAQSYTDSVMAYQVGQLSSNNLSFLVVGAFHTDYRDGVIKQFARYSSNETITIKIVSSAQFGPSELEALLNPHPKYGPVADYLFVVD